MSLPLAPFSIAMSSMTCPLNTTNTTPHDDQLNARIFKNSSACHAIACSRILSADVTGKRSGSQGRTAL